jgi:hypothetical protein
VNILINRLTADGISETFEATSQITVTALGLEDGDTVSFWIVLLTDMQRDPCSCPPGRVTLPQVLDEVPLQCCGEPVLLTRDNPFVIIDAPLNQLMRAKLVTALPSTQLVYFNFTNTHNVNDRLRGCPCANNGA